MEIQEYKLKRDERIKFLVKSGVEISEIRAMLGIDENLIREIGQLELKKIGKRAHKSLDVADPSWN